jgi:hypothetical protein
MLRMASSRDPVFLEACRLADTPPTRRQEAKYFRQHRGKAFAMRREAERKLKGGANE